MKYGSELNDIRVRFEQILKQVTNAKQERRVDVGLPQLFTAVEDLTKEVQKQFTAIINIMERENRAARSASSQ